MTRVHWAASKRATLRPTVRPSSLTAGTVSTPSASGVGTVFTATFSGTSGGADIERGSILIHSNLRAVNGCEVEYQRATNTLRLRDNLALTWIVLFSRRLRQSGKLTMHGEQRGQQPVLLRRDTYAESEHRVQLIVQRRKDHLSERVGYSQPCRWLEGRRLIYRRNSRAGGTGQRLGISGERQRYDANVHRRLQ